jgi:hypothetical protein
MGAGSGLEEVEVMAAVSARQPRDRADGVAGRERAAD